MELIILSGLSGAGKSTAASFFEDMGFRVIDNLPLGLLAPLMESAERLAESDQREGEYLERLVLVMDVRNIQDASSFSRTLRSLTEQNPQSRVVFLEASEETILSRYKQSRRNHPLALGVSLTEAIQQEMSHLSPIRDLATDLIDTSLLSDADLRNLLYRLFRESDTTQRMTLLIESFGFKYGVPRDCDALIDARLIPNPFYVPELKPLTGLDEPVIRFLQSHVETEQLIHLQMEFLRFALPLYQREGKVRMTIGVGCTGGQHRSVAIAEALARQIQSLGYPVSVDHRDIKRRKI